MIHRHTPYDKPRTVSAARREPIYYSNRYPCGLRGESPTEPKPDPKSARRKRKKRKR